MLDVTTTIATEFFLTITSRVVLGAALFERHVLDSKHWRGTIVYINSQWCTTCARVFMAFF